MVGDASTRERVLDEGAETREEIMSATYRVLCDRGYADLSMRAIAEELGKSKSLLHYHYDTKDDLLLAFLDRFLDRLDDYLDEATIEADTHRERLVGFVDQFVVDPDASNRQSFWLALLELRLRAPHDPEFHDRLARNNEAIIDTLAGVIQDGIQAGEFRDVDADRTAETIYTALEGARTRQATLGTTEAPERIRETLLEFVVDDLVVEE